MYDLDDDSLRVLLDDTDVGISVVLPDVLEPRLAEVAHTAALQLGGVAVLVDQQLGNLSREIDVMVVEVKQNIYIYLVERLLAGNAFKVLLVFPRRGLVTRGFLTRAAEPLVSRQLCRGGGLDSATIAPQPGVLGGGT